MTSDSGCLLHNVNEKPHKSHVKWTYSEKSIAQIPVPVPRSNTLAGDLIGAEFKVPSSSNK